MLTIFPEAKMRAVVFGSLMRIITAAKRCAQAHRLGRATAIRIALKLPRRRQPYRIQSTHSKIACRVRAEALHIPLRPLPCTLPGVRLRRGL